MEPERENRCATVDGKVGGRERPFAKFREAKRADELRRCFGLRRLGDERRPYGRNGARLSTPSESEHARSRLKIRSAN